MEITSADRVLISIPLSHGYGFDKRLLSLAAGGTPLILQSDVLPGAMLRTLREQEVTFFPAVPRSSARSPGRVAEAAGARRVITRARRSHSREAAESFTPRLGLPVCQFFGSTETGGISFENRPGDPRPRGASASRSRRPDRDRDGGTVQVHSERAPLRAASRTAGAGVGRDRRRASWSPEGRLRLEGRATLVANVGGLKVDLGALDAFFRSLPGVDDAAAVAVDDAARGIAWSLTSRGRVHGGDPSGSLPGDAFRAEVPRRDPRHEPAAAERPRQAGTVDPGIPVRGGC
jgi:acyl-coenzyme A synthetase/AMP-(fatty) acid ligase